MGLITDYVKGCVTYHRLCERMWDLKQTIAEDVGLIIDYVRGCGTYHRLLQRMWDLSQTM